MAFIIGYILFSTFKNKKVEKFLEFIHIPKNAGTTIENIANENDVKWGRFNTIHKNDVGDVHCSYWHIPPKYMKDDNLYEKDETFCVMRDPYSRIVSEFAYQNQRDPTKNNKSELNGWIKKVLSQKNKWAYNCHLLPQSEYIYDEEGTKLCDNILPFDNLTQSFNDLMQDKNIDVKMEKTRNDNKTYFNLSVKDIDDENLKRIFDYYKKDFETINSIG